MALNILIVDDSRTVRSVIARTIKICAVPVGELFQAENGKEALEILADNWVDIVFSDINMPVMSGIELLEKMSADGMLRTIPVVMVSTEGSQTRIEQLKAKGITAYIRKPFTPEDLQKIIADITGVTI